MVNNQLYPFIIVLKNDRSRFVNILGFLLSFGSAVLFLREMVVMNRIVVPYLAGFVFIVALIAWSWTLYFRKNRDIYYSRALLIAGLVWTRMPYFEWLVVVFAALAVLEYQAKLPPEIGFSEDHIVFNGPFKKRFPWPEIDNVILKDGLLTIDFANNKLFQKEISAGGDEASEQEFNDWCRERLVPAKIS